MRYVVVHPQQYMHRLPTFGDTAALIRVAQVADRLGYYGIACTDHPLWPRSAEAQGVHYDFDPLVSMAVYATNTTRLHIVSSLIIAPYRNAILTAKALSTIDSFSSGRVIVGLGAGYLTEEFDALGVPFEHRNEKMDEDIQVMKELWTSDAASFEGTFYRFHDARQMPPPVQKPHPPLWIGGNSYRAIRRAVDLGDAWFPFIAPVEVVAQVRSPHLDMDELRRRIGYLYERCEISGRELPPEVIAPQFAVGAGWSGPHNGSSFLQSRDEILEHVATLSALGSDKGRVSFTATTVEGFCEQLEWFAEEILPATL